MATHRDRREAAEILRRIVATLPEPTPTQVAFILGQASALDQRTASTNWIDEGVSIARRRTTERPDDGSGTWRSEPRSMPQSNP